MLHYEDALGAHMGLVLGYEVINALLPAIIENAEHNQVAGDTDHHEERYNPCAQ